MRPVTSRSPIQGVIFDFGSTLSILRRPWSVVIAECTTALTGHLRRSGLQLPANFAELWSAMLRFAVQHAERDGIERTADDILAALLASQGYADLTPDFIGQAMDIYFGAEDAVRAPATGALSALAELRAAGYRLAVLSNTISGQWVQRWTDRFGFRPYLDAVVTSDAIAIRKPRPEAFTTTMTQMGLARPEAVVMVGDTVAHDIMGAQAAAMRTVQISLAEDQSFSDRSASSWLVGEITATPDAFITELAGLAPILDRWQSDGR
jgi:FMN phosphatase YigB (HAD superfamily)